MCGDPSDLEGATGAGSADQLLQHVSMIIMMKEDDDGDDGGDE